MMFFWIGHILKKCLCQGFLQNVTKPKGTLEHLPSQDSSLKVFYTDVVLWGRLDYDKIPSPDHQGITKHFFKM